MARVVVPAPAATSRSARTSTPSSAMMRSAASSSASAVVSSCSRRLPIVDNILQRGYGNSVAKSLARECAMAASTDSAASLAYDDEGAGTPVVFLHGLSFDRRSWRSIIARLHGAVES